MKAKLKLTAMGGSLRLVYRLYGLNDEVIKIIENPVKYEQSGYYPTRVSLPFLHKPYHNRRASRSHESCEPLADVVRAACMLRA
jgi:hypothetical protein